MKLKIYEYEKCSTCRNAVKYLEKKKLPFEKISLSEHAPSVAELKKMLGFLEGDLKKLFNTSGKLYRELKISERLKTMTEKEALELLSKNPMLVKRPFVLTAEQGLVGFKEEAWKKLAMTS